MNDSGVKIEAHLLQNFAPSNLNRDDTGQPKSTTFGGFRRARISSQCEKRAARNWWCEHGTVTVGDRTKRLQQLIGNKLAKDEEFVKKVADDKDRKDGIRVFTDAYYAAADKKNQDHTKVLIFIGPHEVDICARAIKDIWDDKTENTVIEKEQKTNTIEGIASIVKKVHDLDAKKANKKINSNNRDETTVQPESEQTVDNENAEEADPKKPKSPKLKSLPEIENRIKSAQVSADIALFGRMLAEHPGLNTDGACQVAHPISTHKVDMEMDFFTAVDDLNPDDETGAGMMGIVGFNSACYYRYALVDRDQLARNLARKTQRNNGKYVQELETKDYEDADKGIEAFLEAMVYVIPTGKQNSFAAQNLPSFGLFVRRQGGVPISLANAFAKPIRPTKDDDDLVGLSVAALTKHWKAIKTVYGGQGVKATTCFHLYQGERLNELKDCDKGSVEKAIDAIMKETK
ncbi:MAG: type I-E CRISPR-associated protein Cas7/Cse4/CasC [Nitrospirae bacterium]|nr:type I-E CRISPR-associated protein Cas7/Cse4/CasC [Nitrospirota bacterium]